MSSVESDQPNSSSLAGMTLGDYQILRRLGRGGMSVVYLAEQQSLKRRVAFKVLKSDLASKESYVRRFHTEAQAAAALVHANIVQIYEVGNLEGIHFIAQEYVAGQNLGQFLQRNGTVSIGLGVNILRQVAAALNRAGKQGIIHRDIKPENIMLAPSGEVKVADFGLARVVNDSNHVEATQIGITMGTPLYMSPEQAEGKSVDPRSDMYSLGVTSYHMFVGHPPFQGETALSIAVQHLKRKPSPVDDHRDDLPPQLTAIIMQMLAKDPEQRFQQATDLQKALRELELNDVDSSWPDDLDRWDWENMSLANARVAATQQLDVLMKTQSLHIRRFGIRRVWILAATVFFFAGMLFGSLQYKTNPLDETTSNKPMVEKHETVSAQYFYASVLNTEAAYRSVEEYFPPTESQDNNHYTLLSHQKIGDLHLESGNYSLAETYYLELIYLGPEEQYFRGFGLVGLANVYHRQQETEKLAEALLSLSETIDELDLKYQMELTTRLDDELRQKIEEFRDSSQIPFPPDPIPDSES